MAWIRVCQECRYKQRTKPPPEYKSESWRDTLCKKCKSPALDYGHEEHPSDEEL